MAKFRALVLIVLLSLLGAACAQQEEPEATDETEEETTLSLEIGDVPSSVEGNVVTIPVDVTGVEIVAADGDTSGDTGHFHVFVDGEPVDEGDAIPRERGIVHSAEKPVKIWGLEPGEHEFTVVVGDGTHQRIHEELEDSVTVEVEGPSVRGTAPATLDAGEDLEISLEAEGVEIIGADNERSDDSGHFHVLIDPEEAPKAGDMIPSPVENEIIHSAEDSVTVSELDEGEHTIWVVLGDGQHYAFDPPVMDKLTVTVG